MNESSSPAEAEDSADNRLRQLKACLSIIAKNVPVSDELLQLLQASGNGERTMSGRQQEGHPVDDGARSAGKTGARTGSLRRSQSEQHLFVGMATLELDRLQQVANCLRIAGHPLMCELLQQTVSSIKSLDQGATEQTEALLFGTGQLPKSLADCLADSPEAQAELAELLSERRLLVWCRESLFDPAGADVMSLRRQHAEESWRAARELRERTAAVTELQTKLSAAEVALSNRDETIAQLESRLSALAAAAGAAEAVDELKRQMEVSRRHQAASESQAQRVTTRLEAYCAAFDILVAETRQFETEAAELLPPLQSPNSTTEAENHAATNGSFVENLRQELDDSHRLASFQSYFSNRFLAVWRSLLDERRQLVQLAQSLAASDHADDANEDSQFQPDEPLAGEIARLIARQSEENSLLTARHRLLLKVLDDNSVTAESAADDELVAAVGSLRQQLAERDRRIASLTKASGSTAQVGSPSPPPQPPRRSAAVARAWDEVAPELGGSGNSSGDLKRYSVLPEIQSASSTGGGQNRRLSMNGGGSAGGVIPHSHRKATRRESNAKKREPPGKPLPANVVSLT